MFLNEKIFNYMKLQEIENFKLKNLNNKNNKDNNNISNNNNNNSIIKHKNTIECLFEKIDNSKDIYE